MANKRPASEMSTSPTPGASSSSMTGVMASGGSNDKSGNGSAGGGSGKEDKDKEEPPNKRIHIEPMNLGSVSSQDEMDIKVLRFQNKKLGERLEMRTTLENELRTRIERQNQRQVMDELVLGFMNKYWTQLEEDLRVMLKRFDTTVEVPEVKMEVTPETVKTEVKTEVKDEVKVEVKQEPGVDDTVKQEPGQEKTNEVRVKDEPKDTPMESVEETKDVTVKKEPTDATVVTNSTPPGGGDEGLSQDSIKSEPDAEGKEVKEEAKEKESMNSFLNRLANSDHGEIDQAIQERCQFSKEAVSRLGHTFDSLQSQFKKTAEVIQNSDKLDEIVKSQNKQLSDENDRLQQLVTSLQQQHQTMTLQLTEQIDKLGTAETKLAESSNMIDDMQYDLSQGTQRAYKLEILLEESYTKLKTATFCGGLNLGDGSKFGDKQLQSIFNELEEQKELATSRYTELEKLQEKHQETVSEMESLKLDLKRLPDHVVVETAAYINLKSQFSLLYKEAQEMKQQLEEGRTQLQKTKNSHLRQIEQMESDELACQKKLRTEVIQLEDTLAQVRKEYEMLRIEFEQNLAANEQAGPINRELRHLVASFQSHNSQLKGEVNRHRRKLKEATAEIVKLKAEVANANSHGSGFSSSSYNSSSSTSSSSERRDSGHDKDHPPGGRRDDHHHHPERRDRDKEREKDKSKDERDRRDSGPKSDADHIKELKANLKKAQESNKEMKLLLDMYKGAAKEQRDKVQLMAAERRVRCEVDELRQRLRHSEDNRERSDNRNVGDEDTRRKIRTLEEAVHQLQKKLGEKKQEEEALLSEMDVTGQAFEDMQEQNTRLLQQLREKDDANFKLMSERIKANQIHKLLREEKDVLGDQVATYQTQVDAQNQVVRKLEEKERILQNNLSTVEKEMSFRQQGLELHKRKALETSSSSADSQCRLDRINGQIEELQRAVREKASAVEQENHKFRRAQEESQSLRRKIERYKRMELATTTDEVLMEEVRTYKEQLTCPCCKKGRKDVVLTKCFHVFCFECIKTRYETRQRKCPKCNHGFGANDYHRIWLD